MNFVRTLGLALFALAGLVGCSGGEQDTARTTISMNDGWQFQRSEGDGVTEWEAVKLPHTARLEPEVVNDQWQGDAWYRKSLTVDPSWRGKRLILRFEGAMNAATLSVNGHEVAHHLGGYLPFVVDLTDAVQFDAPNDILVHLDNRDNPVTGPKPLHLLDFNMYGGLYRGASLTVLNPVHITDEILADKVAGGGIFVTYPKVARDMADVRVQTHVANTGVDLATAQVRHTLRNGTLSVDRVTGSPFTLAAGADGQDIQTIALQNPALWSVRSPNLYTLVTEVLLDGDVVDRKETRIGIRDIKITKDGFVLNGEKMFLRGVNRHQEYPHIGYALSANADYRDAVKIKEAGFDYVRLSHYPHSPAFMEAADELGLVVLDAILGWQYYNDDPAFTEHAIRTCRDLIRRDRNHPSVIAWECSLNETQMPVSLVEAFHNTVHEEFPGAGVYSAGWQNDGFDIYVQARQHRLQHYTAPDRPYIVSEYGDWEYYAQNAGFNQQAWAGLKEAERTSRQLLRDGERRLLQQATNIQEAHNDNFRTPAFADGYWVMFDYNRGYADDIESSGIMSLYRVPKYSWYFFKSQRDAGEASAAFGSGPMVFIANEWTENSPLDVRVFSNADEVELLVNGKHVGRQAPDRGSMSDQLRHPPFTFHLEAYEAGTLEAVGYIGGEVAARHTVRTPGAPARIELTLDRSGRAPEAGVKDAVFAYARIVDENGTTVPLNDVALHLDLMGDAEIMNPEAPVTQNGIAAILLRIGDSGGKVVLRATGAAALSLQPAELVFEPAP